MKICPTSALYRADNGERDPVGVPVVMRVMVGFGWSIVGGIRWVLVRRGRSMAGVGCSLGASP